jgi:hypothetical protein
VKDGLEAFLSSVSAWFYNSGKNYLKTGEIKKVAPATSSYFTGCQSGIADSTFFEPIPHSQSK